MSATLPQRCFVIPDIVLLTPKDIYWSFTGRLTECVSEIVFPAQSVLRGLKL